jgi:pimeloyl-ACP methyl ester carboxylesterase
MRYTPASRRRNGSAAGVDDALLSGHSMGSLVALEASQIAPQRVRGLALVGTTYPMKVSDALLATSLDDEPAAIDMVNIWSHSSIAPARSTKLLTSTIAHGRVVTVDAGHALMAEQPDAVLDALFGFAGTLK